MAIQFPSGFKIASNEPIDARFVLSLEQMRVAHLEMAMPEVYWAICSDDGKIYVYNKANSVTQFSGKFRVLNSVLPISDTETIEVKVDPNNDTKYIISLIGKDAAPVNAVLRKHIREDGSPIYNWDVIYDKQELDNILSNKVDAVNGYSLISVEDIAKINNLPEKFDTVAASEQNGNLLINGEEVTVYNLPDGTVQDTHYQHTDNNFTDKLKDKLMGISANADVSPVSDIQVVDNGKSFSVLGENKIAQINLETKQNKISPDSPLSLDVTAESDTKKHFTYSERLKLRNIEDKAEANKVIDIRIKKHADEPFVTAVENRIAEVDLSSKQDLINAKAPLSLDITQDSDNFKRMTSAERTKLKNIEDGAEKNKVTDVHINDASVVVENVAKIEYETALDRDSGKAPTATAVRQFVKSSIANSAIWDSVQQNLFDLSKETEAAKTLAEDGQNTIETIEVIGATATKVDKKIIINIDTSSFITKDLLDSFALKTDLKQVALTGNYADLVNVPVIPEEITEETVADWGFSKFPAYKGNNKLLKIVDGIASWGDLTMDKNFTTLYTVGNLPSGTEIKATDTLKDILYSILRGVVLDSITVNADAVNTKVFVGESLNPAGLIVTGTYEDGTTTVLTDYDLSPDIITADTTYIVVNVNGKRATFAVYPHAKVNGQLSGCTANKSLYQEIKVGDSYEIELIANLGYKPITADNIIIVKGDFNYDWATLTDQTFAIHDVRGPIVYKVIAETIKYIPSTNITNGKAAFNLPTYRYGETGNCIITPFDTYLYPEESTIELVGADLLAYDPLTGNVTFAVNGDSENISIAAICKEAPIDSLEIIDTADVKTDYLVGESLNLTGLMLRATYSNNSAKTVSWGDEGLETEQSPDYTFELDDYLTGRGEVGIALTYSNLISTAYTSLNVNLEPAPLPPGTILSMPTNVVIKKDSSSSNAPYSVSWDAVDNATSYRVKETRYNAEGVILGIAEYTCFDTVYAITFTDKNIANRTAEIDHFGYAVAAVVDSTPMAISEYASPLTYAEIPYVPIDIITIIPDTSTVEDRCIVSDEIGNSSTLPSAEPIYRYAFRGSSIEYSVTLYAASGYAFSEPEEVIYN